MTHFDLTPVYRSSIGFDRMATLFDSLLAQPHVTKSGTSYPPYNVERVDDANYRLTLAVAGFGTDDIEIETREGELVIRGRKTEDGDESALLYRGIANRNFERRFHLADNVLVTAANLENGLLELDFERQIPEAEQFRRIPIGNRETLT